MTNFGPSRGTVKKWVGEPQIGKKYLRSTYLIKDQDPERTRRKASNPILKLATHLKRQLTKEHIWIANKYMKMCSTALVIRQMQIEAIMRDCHTRSRTTKWREWQRQMLVGVWSNWDRCVARGCVKQPLGDKIWQSLMKPNTHLPSGPTILLPGIYMREMEAYAHLNKRTKKTCTRSSEWLYS